MTAADLEIRRANLGEGDLVGLLDRLTAKAGLLLDRPIVIPTVKAMLSTEGGVCPTCHDQLAFDPWSPDRHQCPRCGAVATGPRHDAHWARAQHLWVAERAAHLAALAVLTDDEAFAAKSRELLRGYHRLYFELPNRDNVLGPTHLFFSTYLESIWILNYLAAAHLLRERGWLDEAEIEAVGAIAEEAAALIGDFNEGMSNRQTWNAAALAAIAVWFDDDELGQIAIAGRTGLLGHLTDGFDDDGMWSEGENYHLFAVRGLLLGLEWSRAAGADLLEDPALAHQLERALMAPARTALPDYTFPARKDSRFGVSLAHPAYLECWEHGLARLGDQAPPELASWLEQLYRQPSSPARTYDAYLHDAGEPDRDRATRLDLSWWMLLSMEPTLPEAEENFVPTSALFRRQGVAILRQHDRYLSLECGGSSAGHGHPDRLHLTVHAAGVHWLADPGAGSYVNRDLFWYRSTLAHNAPRLDRVSQAEGEARCQAFEDRGDWGWISAESGPIRRRLIHGPDWMIDVVDLSGDESHLLELPWHLDGAVSVETAGRWEPDQLEGELVTEVTRFVPDAGTDVVLVADGGDGRVVRLHLVGGVVIRATGPGRPVGAASRRPFHLVRATGSTARLVAVLDFGETVRRVDVGASEIGVVAATGTTVVRLTGDRATVVAGGKTIELGGVIPIRPPVRTLMAERPAPAEGEAIRIDHRPALDGSLEGFDDSSPLPLDDEIHYLRSEEPYPGPEAFSAIAHVNWDTETVYLAVTVTKPEVIVAERVMAPLHLDNEPDDIHLDGIQVYYRLGAGPVRAFLIRPIEGGGLVARTIPVDANGSVGVGGSPPSLEGGSTLDEAGYCLTVALPCPELHHLLQRPALEFDLVVNEAHSGRVRRAGQLAWGGGHGWVYLRGDRRPQSEWGRLDLI